MHNNNFRCHLLLGLEAALGIGWSLCNMAGQDRRCWNLLMWLMHDSLRLMFPLLKCRWVHPLLIEGSLEFQMSCLNVCFAVTVLSMVYHKAKMWLLSFSLASYSNIAISRLNYLIRMLVCSYEYRCVSCMNFVV